MGRIRATTARSDLDSQVQRHIADAERSLQAASRLCRAAGKTVSGPERRRAQQASRDIGRLLTGLAGIRRVTPLYDLDDPDLNEDALAAWRDERLAAEEPPLTLAEEAPQPEPETDDSGGGE